MNSSGILDQPMTISLLTIGEVSWGAHSLSFTRAKFWEAFRMGIWRSIELVGRVKVDRALPLCDLLIAVSVEWSGWIGSVL